MQTCIAFIIAVAATFFLQGCVTQMSPQAKGVRLITDAAQYNCEFKGIVTGSASLGWTTAHNAEGAFNDVMNKAAKKGANAILISDSDSNSDQSTAVAGAYLCDFD